MRKYIASIALLLPALMAAAQQTDSVAVNAEDTVFTRSVTVEREFQPTIQSAGKISMRPTVVEPVQIEKPEVRYSDITTPIAPSSNLPKLPAQRHTFTQGEPLHGYLRFGIGHPQTLFDFGYEHVDRKNSVLVAVNHEQDWGLKADGHTELNFRFAHKYSTGSAYINVKGANEYFTRYGRYYDETLNPEMKAWTNGLSIERSRELERHGDKQTVWRGEVVAGVKSNNKPDFQYQAELAYKAYAMTSIVSEHQVNVRFNGSYSFLDDHKVGAKLYSQNQILVAGDSMKARWDRAGQTPAYNNRYCVRIEPYYEYVGRRVLVHAGVNLDFNVGKGNQMSATDSTTALSKQVAFAPSPNVRLEAQLAPKWCVLFVDVRGKFGMSSMAGYMDQCRYQNMYTPILSHHVSGYTPMDASVGFRFRPQKSLLINIHGGYSINKNQALFAYGSAEDLSFIYSDYGQVKIGGDISYHYRDIVNLHIFGDYYLYTGVQNNTANNEKYTASADQIYDRPNWRLGLDLEGNINRHWSVYTRDRFEGRRVALTTMGDRTLPYVLDVNLGARYRFAGTGKPMLDQLAVFAELQNVLHRRHQYFYGYQTEGIHGRIGLTWRF